MLVSEAFGGSGGIAKFNRDFMGAIVADERVALIDAVPRLAGEPVALPDRIACDWRAAQGKLAFLRAVARRLAGRDDIAAVLCGHIHLLPPAWLLARLSGVPLILIVHGYEAWTPPRRLLARVLAPRIDALIAVSRISAERFCGWTGLAAAKSFVLPNGVDLERFRPGPRNEALAARYGLGAGPMLLTLGRMAAHERYKGFDKVIELMPRLRQRFPGLLYAIAGEGDDRPRLQAKAATLGLGEAVIFTGAVAEADKVDLYNLADVFVLPSTGEGFGIVLLEAAACGLAIIGSSRDGSREALRGGELGALVDPDDDDALAGAIADALREGRGRERKASVEHFSMAAFSRRVSEWLDGFAAAETMR